MKKQLNEYVLDKNLFNVLEQELKNEMKNKGYSDEEIEKMYQDSLNMKMDQEQKNIAQEILEIIKDEIAEKWNILKYYVK